MSNVTPFPGAVTGIGEHFPAQTLRVGIEEAERRGIARDRSAAVLDHDRPIATHMLCLLGSPGEMDRRMGEMGLLRLLGSMAVVA